MFSLARQAKLNHTAGNDSGPVPPTDKKADVFNRLGKWRDFASH